MTTVHVDCKPSPAPLPGLNEVFEQHGSYVYRALRYFGVPERDLPDVCQETFLVVHRKLPEFEGRSALRTWLYRICRRTASDYRRRAHVRRETMLESPQDHVAPDVRSGNPQLEARQLLLHALDQLDEDKRLVFVLFEIEGLTMNEVVDVIECPLQTAYSRLHAARRLVEQVVREAHQGAA